MKVKNINPRSIFAFLLFIIFIALVISSVNSIRSARDYRIEITEMPKLYCEDSPPQGSAQWTDNGLEITLCDEGLDVGMPIEAAGFAKLGVVPPVQPLHTHLFRIRLTVAKVDAYLNELAVTGDKLRMTRIHLPDGHNLEFWITQSALTDMRRYMGDDIEAIAFPVVWAK